MRKIFIIAFLFFGISAFAQTADKIAAYNMDSVLDTLPEMKKAVVELDVLQKNLQSQLSGMKADIDRKKHEYDSLSPQWSPLISALKQKEIQDLESNLLVFNAKSDSTYENRRKELVDPILQKVEDAAFAVAKEKKCAKVIDTSNTEPAKVYGSNTICIYEDVCRKLGIPGYSKK